MKVIAINGSPHEKGNTFKALETVMNELQTAGIETEVLHIGHKNIRGCIACYGCITGKTGTCVINEEVNASIEKIRAADGLLIGSPVYYAGIAGTLKSFLDRVFFASTTNGNHFRHKVAAGVTAQRRAGGVQAFEQLNKYFTIAEMQVAGSNYWNGVHGAAPGEAEKDEEGIQTMRILGRNMAYMLKLREAGKETMPEPEAEVKIKTNLVR